MEYEVITSEYLDEVTQRVSERLSEGWRCVGGVSITCYNFEDSHDNNSEKTQMVYAQAILKGDADNYQKIVGFLAHSKDSCNNAMALGIRVGDFIEHHPEIFSEYRKPS